MSKTLIAVLLAVPLASFAQSDDFPFGDPRIGKQALESKCSSCHVSRWGGDGSGVFRRGDRKVSSAQSLLAWVQKCNAGQKTGLSAEEEQSVAAYLNQAYYKFK
jgi:hypothetical protein